jgi:DNA-binding NtrC family response regulator
MNNKTNITVLLIDDEETLVKYLSTRLLREGFTVNASYSGEEALEVACNKDFDVAVVDLKMPGMDGVETQKRLKRIHPFLQSIILTDRGALDSALENGKQDVFKCLLKPIDYENLVQTIREAYKKKIESEQSNIGEEAEETCRPGRETSGMKSAVNKLCKIYGIN